MSFKQSLLKGMETEIRVCKHLFTKIPEGKMDFKPAENMRSVSDLLRYLTWCASATVIYSIKKSDGVDTAGTFQGFVKDAKEMNLEDFPAAMDKQYKIVSDAIKDFTDEDLSSKISVLPWGDQVSLGYALQETGVKFLTAYRMQLFLYLKELGVQVDTINNWMGIDPEPIEEEEEEVEESAS